MRIETGDVAYRDGEAQLDGMFAVDASESGARPGVLVIHGGAGLDDHARGRARRFAEAGFVAFACDLYGQGVKGNREQIMKTIGMLRADRAALVRRVQPAIDVLSTHPLFNGRSAAVGYCLGGLVALELARSGAPLDAVVSVHGNLTTTTAPAEASAIKARILACHGALDPHAPMTQVSTFADEMTRAGADYQLIVYGGAMHGFTHEHDTGQNPGVRYDAAADRRSSLSILNFLDEVFGSPLRS